MRAPLLDDGLAPCAAFRRVCGRIMVFLLQCRGRTIVCRASRCGTYHLEHSLWARLPSWSLFSVSPRGLIGLTRLGVPAWGFEPRRHGFVVGVPRRGRETKLNLRSFFCGRSVLPIVCVCVCVFKIGAPQRDIGLNSSTRSERDNRSSSERHPSQALCSSAAACLLHSSLLWLLSRRLCPLLVYE